MARAGARDQDHQETFAVGEPLPTAAFEGTATRQYCEAFAKLEAGEVTAMPAFASLVGLHADDALAGFHLRRLLNGAKGVRMQISKAQGPATKQTMKPFLPVREVSQTQ
jgi:hypothetical protein